jgi:hypothetical protein
MLLAEKGVRGKGRQPLSTPPLTLTPTREQRFGLKTTFRSSRQFGRNSRIAGYASSDCVLNSLGTVPQRRSQPNFA